MAEIQKKILRGLLLQDRRLELWEAQSGEYNAGGTRLAGIPTGGNLPGIPDPVRETDLLLRSSGSQSTGKLHRVLTHFGGFPDRGGGAFIWREAGGTWFGWDTPNAISGWDALNWTSSTSAQWFNPHAVVLDDGTVLGAVVQGTIASTVRSLARNPNTGAWTDGEMVAGVVNEAHPCLVLLPSGRVLCFYWAEDIAAQTANVGMMYTDDRGVTWTRGSFGVLPSSIDTSGSSGAGAAGYDLERLRAAYKDGQVLLVACLRAHDTSLVEEDLLVQYASADLGNNFVEVDRSATTTGTGGNFQDLVVVDGRFVLAYIAVVDKLPRIVRLANAYHPFSAETALSPASGTEVWGTGIATVATGDLAAFRDEAGNVYLTGRQPSVQNEWIVIRSADGGVTWSEMARSSGTSGCGKWWDSADASTYPSDACAVFHQGRAIVIHGHASSPGAYNESMSATYLGGYTTITLPAYESFRVDTNQVTYAQTYLPFDLPEDCSWSASGAGSGSIASGLLRVTAIGGVARWYDRSPSGSVSAGIIATQIVDPSAGTAYFLVRLDDGAEGYEVEVRVSTTDIEVWDAVAGTQIGTTTTRTAGTEVEVRVAMEDDNAEVTYRLYDTTSKRSWSTVATSSALTDSGGAAGSNRVRFGIPPLGVSTREIDWRFVAYVTDEGSGYVGQGLVSFTNPADLFARPYSSLATYVDDGFSIRASDGPTQRGDEWNVDTRYTYGPEHLLPVAAPSPRDVWRSVPFADLDPNTDEIRIAWRIDSDGAGDYLGADCALENDLLGVWLDEVNCAEIKVDLYYSGAWVPVGNTEIQKFTGARQGNTVRASSSSASGGTWRRAEAAGCGIAFYSGGGGYAFCDWTGTVERNTEGGTLTAGGTTKRPTFVLEETDPLTSTSPNVAIWPKRHLMVIHASGFARAVQGVRIRIKHSGPTGYPGRPAAGFYQVGKVVFGSFAVFGFDYSWQREIAMEPNTELSILDDGGAVSRVRGRPGRTVSINWADGVELVSWRIEEFPDYVKASANTAAEAVAFWGDIPFFLQDVVRELDGAHIPVVYCPYIPYDATNGATGDWVSYYKSWGAGAVYGRIVSPVRIEQVLGDEEVDEIYRVTTVEIREER